MMGDDVDGDNSKGVVELPEDKVDSVKRAYDHKQYKNLKSSLLNMLSR